MKKTLLVVVVGLLVLLASATSSWAFTPIPSGESIQVWTAINKVFTNLSLAAPVGSNTAADAYQVGMDDYWANLAGPKGGDVASISISAGNYNSLYAFLQGSAVPGSLQLVVDPVLNGTQYSGDGKTAGTAYVGSVNPIASGAFGFALQSDNSGTVKDPDFIWYSDPTLNSDKKDHMLTYNLPQLDGFQIWLDDGATQKQVTLSKDSYLLAWEDVTWNGADKDFNDAIYLVSKVKPIPEPMSLMLLGSGLLGLFGLRKKTS